MENHNLRCATERKLAENALYLQEVFRVPLKRYLLMVGLKRKNPTQRWLCGAFLNLKLDDDLLSHGISHTTIGDGAFHF